MKIIILTTLLFSFCMATNAQTSPPVPDPRWGAQGTRTVTKTTDPNNLDQITTIEYKDDDGRVREKVTWKKDINGKYTRIDEIFTQSGRPMCKVTDRFNSRVESISREGVGYRKDGSEYKPESVWLELRFEKVLRNEIKSIEEGGSVSVAPAQGPCMSGTACSGKLKMFLGYSYLSGFGDNGESFPLGGKASLAYNLTPDIALGPDISYHTKKTGDQTISRMFFLAKGQYNFGSDYNPNDTTSGLDFSSNNCLPKLAPDFHVYLGLCTERSVINTGANRYTSSGSGFAFGAGVGLSYKLSNSIALGAQVDYIGVKFKNQDEMINNAVASFGVIINLMRSGQIRGGSSFR
ncbi:MAG: hypothetical protein V4722_21805 [Bacteroidota bacterium]